MLFSSFLTFCPPPPLPAERPPLLLVLVCNIAIQALGKIKKTLIFCHDNFFLKLKYLLTISASPVGKTVGKERGSRCHRQENTFN